MMMKRILFLTVFSGLFFVSALAQLNGPSGSDTTSANSLHRNPKLRLPSPETFRYRILPNDSINYRKLPNFRMPEWQRDSLRRQQFMARRRHPFDKMPIVGFQQPYTSRMPVYKPDPAIDFKLKIKRIGKPEPFYIPR